MKIERDRVKRRVSLTQKAYLQKVLQKFLIGEEAKSVSSPLTSSFKLSARMSPMSYIPYSSAVGSLMYAMVCTRSDFSQPMNIVSRYMHDPGRVIGWILQYIKGTIGVGLFFRKDVGGKQECTGYVDSDYAGDLDNRRSITGYVFTLSQAPVSFVILYSLQ